MNSVKRLCRICMVKEKKEKLVPIFGDSANYEKATDIFMISGVQIIDFPSCPALICSKCIKDLAKAITFRNRCKDSDQLIRENEEKSSWIKELNCSENEDVLFENVQFKTERIEPSSIKIEEIVSGQMFDDIFSTIKAETILKENFSENDYEDGNFEGDDVETPKRDDKNLTCEICHKTFKNKKFHNMHCKKAHKKYRQKSPRSAYIGCHYCNKYFESVSSIIRHINYKHETERATCDECGESFKFKTRLPRHFKTVHDRTIPKQPRPPRHKKELKVQSEPLAFPCSVCGRICNSKSFLSAHEKTHIKFKPEDYFYCDVCGNKFKRKRKLINHINERHVLQIRYACPQCPGKSWARKDHMNRHIKVVHYRIRNFKCEWCGKDFPERKKLENHTRIHTGEKPFECSFCHKRFMHEVDHMRHVWTHKGGRKFKCMSCRKTYDTKKELVDHRTHCVFYSYNQHTTYL